MKLSYLWLKEFLDVDAPPEEVARLLRGLGFDTVSVSRCGGPVSGVVVARVETREKHPNADKLSLCTVFDGKERLRIVCGAPNVAPGLLAPLARVGARLPGGMEIKAAVIRGEPSQGMLCSRRELGLGEDHAGLMALPPDTPLGQDIAKALFLEDAVIEIEVTPNRPDVLSHWGAARELAAALGKKLRMPELSLPRAKDLAGLVRVEDPSLCSRYIGRVLEGVAPGPSPLWMSLRLERCGARSINNLVDVTNYVLLELGHPLHVFDRDRLSGGRVTARTGRPGEKLICLDGAERAVDGALVIADDAAPQAVAGVMGGLPSAVTDGTRNVLLEAAHFQPAQVRRTRTRLRLSTESSYRFERGTDPEIADWASRRAARLILDLAGGRLAGGKDVFPAPPKTFSFALSPARVEGLLGVPLSKSEVSHSLERLGFRCAPAGAGLKVSPPIHRRDVREVADAAEEVARLLGYDRVPARARAAAPSSAPRDRLRDMIDAARRLMTGFGFLEAVNSGLTGRAEWEKLLGPADGTAVALDNPLSQSLELLSPTLLINLLSNLGLNLRRGNARVRLFEVGRVFSREGGAVREAVSLGWVAAGGLSGPHWKHPDRAVDIWDAKSWVKALLKDWRVLGLRSAADAPAGFLHPGESQSLFVGEKRVGAYGLLHPARADALDVPRETLAGELDLTALAAERFAERRHDPLPRHPALFRDLSVVFPENVPWSTVAMWLMRRSERVENVELFDVFEGDALPPGRRSLAFRLTLRHADRALTDAEAGELQDRILAGLKADFDASPRAAA